ncbi:MAG: ABC transporter permease subunit [Planctomycetota bacterium]|nr:MAG: ABC transporter permease subunit [Planctomycetota bacterium]
MTAERAKEFAVARRSESLFRMRLRKFRRLKRGYYSFCILATAYVGSFFLPFLMNDKALVVRYRGRYYFPAFRSYLHDTFGYHPWLGVFENRVYPPQTFGQRSVAVRTDYRALKEQFEAAGTDDFVILPPIPYSPFEQFLEEEGNPPAPPSRKHWLGTDDRGRDVLVRLAYGFRISITFALLVTGLSYAFGTLVGAVLGYYGGWVDLFGLRFVEIWGAIPFLYTVIIISSLVQPGFLMLVLILAAFGWLGITFYIRGEFYREKAKDYVAAAIATGESNPVIIVKHILPNALTPIIAFAPFAIVANILTLVALDFLGFGLPAPTPSWGELIKQGKENIREWHLVVFPLLAMFLTLQLIVFIGEAVREAFDPKVYSRLR